MKKDKPKDVSTFYDFVRSGVGLDTPGGRYAGEVKTHITGIDPIPQLPPNAPNNQFTPSIHNGPEYLGYDISAVDIGELASSSTPSPQDDAGRPDAIQPSIRPSTFTRRV